MTTRGKPFAAGKSGNPAGRPKGLRTKVSVAVSTILEAEAEDIARAIVSAAKGGDPTAMRLAAERLCPVRKGAPITFALRPITSEADATAAMADVLASVASGTITPEEGQSVASLVGTFLEAVRVHEHSRRLEAIEASLAAGGQHAR